MANWPSSGSTGSAGTEFAEDTAHGSGDEGTLTLAVRRDANTSLVDATGDYAPLQVDSIGSLKVAIISGAGSGGTAMVDDAAFTAATTSVNPVGYLADESSPDSVDEGDIGAPRMTLTRKAYAAIADPVAERTATVRDTGSSDSLNVSIVDASGNQITSFGGGTQFAEDAAHTTGDVGTMALAVRRDTAASSAGTDGDYATLNTNSSGKLWVASEIISGQAAITGGAGAVAAGTPRMTLASDDPAVATLGAVADAAATAGSTGSLSAKLRLATTQLDAIKTAAEKKADDIPVAITRSNNTTAYPANSVVGGAQVFALSNVPAGPARVVGAELLIEDTQLRSTEAAYRLYFYSVTPPSALADNAAWDLPSGDRASFLGFIDIGTPTDLGSTIYVQAPGLDLPVKLATANLYFYLVTILGYTPTAQRVYNVKLHIDPR